jgi:hypothetical protein
MAYTHARREELARAKGYSSYVAERRASKTERVAAAKLLAQRSRGSYRGKPVKPARTGWEKLAPATRRRHQAEGITPNLYRAGALLRQTRGMRIVSAGQVVDVNATTKAQRSLVGRYNRMAQIALESGEAHHLRPFVGKLVDGFELECDLGVLEDMDQRGELDFEPYGETATS